MTEQSLQHPDVPGQPLHGVPTGPRLDDATHNDARQPDIDGALAERLAKLTAARARTAGATVPPTGRTNAPRAKRRHPAKHSRTAALALSVLASSGLGVFFAMGDSGVSASPAEPTGLVTPSAAPAAPIATTPSTSTATTPATSNAPTTTAAAAAAAAVVNGDSYSNKYGNVQVQATFAADGTLTDVTTLEVPSRDGDSVNISNFAVPRLNSSALTTQSANVNTVSGATYTSNGYKKSLQSAIDLAVASGIPVATGA